MSGFPVSLNAFFNGPKFKRQSSLESSDEIVKWWESRRVFFNVVVGSTGLVTCALVVICILASDATVGEAIGLPDGPLLGVFGIIAYGIMANICFTAGWISELILRSMLTPERSSAYGLKAFRFGIQFSILITLLPALICWLIFVIALASGQKHAPPPAE
jgi:hypothetical protein